MNKTQILHDIDNNIPVGSKDVKALLNEIILLETAIIRFAEIVGHYPLEVLQFIKNEDMLGRLIK